MKKANPREEASPKTHHNDTTYQEVALVLSFIPANLPRDQWVQIAMALKSAGFDFEVFNTWSATADNYDPKAARDTWKSIKADGGITPKTIFHFAKQYGYNPALSKTDFKPVITLDTVRQEKAEKARQQAAESAAERANSILDDCNYSPENHQYLVQKKIKPPIKVWQFKDALVIPVMDLQGNIHSLQFIQPDGQKRFLKDGAIKGNFYQIWSRKKPSDAIVIAEGFATGCTLAQHFTSDCSVIVAFNSGNLKPVAQVFREAFPGARILIAGDADDAGRKSAFKAAEAVNGDVALPIFVDGEIGTDWNDRWCLDEVKHGR